MDLVREYAARNSEPAFETLVRRHVSLVYSVALRQVGNPAQAEEITQAVFLILSRKAARLRPDTVLPGWLHETARFASASFLRGELRRQRREQEAYVQSKLQESTTDPAWEQLAPLLDEAIGQLGKADRNAVVLRFFQNKSAREIAAALNVHESAAQKRLNRAVEKLRAWFLKRGVAVSGGALIGALSVNSVQGAPAHLAASVMAVSAKGTAVSGSTLTLIKGALKIMAWTKMKTAVVVGTAVILAAGVTTSIIVHNVHQKRAMASKAELTEAGNGAYGLYIHYGIATFANPGEKGTIPASRFAPASLDVQSWAHAAKQAGMTFAVLTAKHESGFCLWDSQDYSYDVGGSPFKGDIIADFIAACKAEGIAPGVHYSIPDEFNEGAVVSPAYFDIIKKHITELHTSYPDLRVQIFDMSSRLSQAQFDELRQIVKRLNPQCIVWGTVGGQMPNHNSDTVIQSWMWTPNARLNPAQSLVKRYQQSRAAGKAFVLNVGPDTTGRIPNDQLAVLMQVKKLID
jgi:RNA polymerase sigma factor (sigma-70 family)